MSNLNHLFTVEYSDIHTPVLQSGDQSVTYPLDQFVTLAPSAARLLQLRLTQVPSVSNHHQYTIDYLQQDGEQYSVSTAIIEFE